MNLYNEMNAIQSRFKHNPEAVRALCQMQGVITAYLKEEVLAKLVAKHAQKQNP